MKPSQRPDRRTHRGRRAGFAGGLILVIVSIVIGAASVAGAQETEPAEPVEVSVSEEPGVCTELGAFCERLMEWTGNEQFSETTAWLIGTPLKIPAILLAALFVNRPARRTRGSRSRRTPDRRRFARYPD